MSLVSRCPACATAFRVQREQLTARGGAVRCGKCGTVFDGIAALVDEGAERVWLDPSPQLGLFDPSRQPPPPPPDAPAEAPVPEFLAEPPPPSRWAVWLWGFAAFLALVALGAQAVYRYRAELAAMVPQARAPLDAACRRLGCTVSLPRRVELMSIESSDLQADPQREGIIVLNAVLRNRAAVPQEYPALELTLTDHADRPILRRVLLPGEYLEGASVREGIAPGAEAALRVYLDAGATRASGYRLYLFFPA